MIIKNQYIFFILVFVFFTGCKRKRVTQDRLCSRVDLEQITKLIPRTSEEIYLISQQGIDGMNQALYQLDQVSAEQRTYVNTVLVYEQAYFQFFMNKQILRLMADLSTDSALQTAANVALLDYDDYERDILKNNVSLYQALSEYEKYGKDPYRFTKPVVFFLEHELEQAKLAGMNLSVDQRTCVHAMKADVQHLAGKFRSNIIHDQRSLLASKSELQGCDSTFIESLACDEFGNCIVPVNQNNYDIVMSNCTNSDTRRNYFMLFKQLGYPANESILSEIHSKLTNIAKILNFEDWASYQLMLLNRKSVKKIESFLHALIKDVQDVQSSYFDSYASNIPLHLLTSDKKLNPWDYEYAQNAYIKKCFNVDDELISQYFVLDRFLPEFLKQISKFFHITFEKQQDYNLWAPGVICYRIRSLKHQAILGYLFFDLYQRFAKRDLQPYEIYLVPVIRDDCSIPCVGATVVVANFKQGDQDHPTLLHFKEVHQLVYQIGQALHSIFAATRFTQFSGHQVACDFENISGQTLSKWLDQSCFVQLVSSHIENQSALNKKMIEKLIARNTFERNKKLLQNLFLSVVALQFFQKDSLYNFHHWIEKLYKKTFKNVRYIPNDYFEMSFVPLSDIEQGVAHYADLWSEVIAADLFAHIKEQGILDYEIGMQYVTDILSPGGSKDPSEMVKKFLGRSFNRKSFIAGLTVY